GVEAAVIEPAGDLGEEPGDPPLLVGITGRAWCEGGKELLVVEDEKALACQLGVQPLPHRRAGVLRQTGIEQGGGGDTGEAARPGSSRAAVSTRARRPNCFAPRSRREVRMTKESARWNPNW